ncbi:MAG: hypothetical protein LBH70_02815, partial [Spirochaetaceae bacterium]|nr:hypothetical protein [Spirochaetaceae bacterium]
LDHFNATWNMANLGYGMNISALDNKMESFVDSSIGLEHSGTRIGIEYSPVNYWTRAVRGRSAAHIETTRLSFLNFTLYWNMFELRFFDDMFGLYFGPFNKINYMNLDENHAFRRNEFIYTGGFRAGLVLIVYKNIYYNILGGQIGYRNINGNNTFYAAVSVDFIVYMIVLFSPNDITQVYNGTNRS